MSKPTQFALSLLFIFVLIVTVIPELMVNFTMSYYNDSAMANMHVTTSTNLIIAFVTVLYVLLTGKLVTTSKESIELSKESIEQNKRSIELSKEAIEQSRKEQQIKDIENRLEKFYIPAEDLINGKLKKNREQTINGWPPANYIGLKDLRKYSYLADKETYKAYETYIESNCREPKEITCQDKYSNKPKGFTVCEDYKSGCHNQYDKCPHNLNYCKHYNECPPKDQSGIIQDNTKCKYYINLKDTITKDIEHYKNELLKLKK